MEVGHVGSLWCCFLCHEKSFGATKSRTKHIRLQLGIIRFSANKNPTSYAEMGMQQLDSDQGKKAQKSTVCEFPWSLAG